MVARQSFKSANEWAHTRKIMWVIAAVNSTKPIDIYELMPLLIDPPNIEPEPMTPEELEVMRQEGLRRVQAMQAYINNQK